MRLLSKLKLTLAVAGFALGAGLQAFEQVGSDFTVSITSKAFDRCSGTLYVGTVANNTTSNVQKVDQNGTSFTILGDNDITNKEIVELSLLPNNRLTGKSGDNCDTCAASGQNATHIAAIFGFRSTDSHNIAVGRTDTAKWILSGKLYDAGSATLARRVSHITTSSTCVLGRTVDAVDVVSGDGDNSGVATIRVDKAGTAGVPTLRVIQGSATTASRKLDRTSIEVKGGQGLPFRPASTMTVQDMTWDDELQTAYFALRVAPERRAGTYAFGLVRGTFSDNNCTLSLQPITKSFPRTGALATASGDINAIFAIGQGGNNNNFTATVDIRKIRVMHTSTGLDYLIINGGINKSSTGNLPGNKIYALPLGSKTTSQAGCIVQNVCSECVDCNCCPFFDTPLASTSFHVLDVDNSVTVGTCPAPWRHDRFASDMVVVGDTVYASFGDPLNPSKDANKLVADANVNPGVWASHAMFDHCGRITNWTNWERVWTSTDGGVHNSGLGRGDKVPLFDVDAETGKLLTINSERKQVNRSKWETSSTANTLPAVISSNLSDGVFTMLDLKSVTASCDNDNAYPAGFASTTGYALFGGKEKVLFVHAETSFNRVITGTAINNAGYIKLTSSGLTSVSGDVLSLAYTNDDFRNWFFAGTQKGLFAFGKSNGTAFNTHKASGNQFANLDAAPHASTDKWHQVAISGTNITDAVTHIMTCSQRSAAHIYFVAQDITSKDSVSDKVYRMDLNNSVTAMGNTAKIIAQSGKGSFPSNLLFTGAMLVTNTNHLGTSNKAEGCACYMVISTNDGIWTSTTDPHRIASVDDKAWVQIPRTDNIAFNFLRNLSKVTSRSSTGWSIFFTDGELASQKVCPGIFQNSRLLQFSNDVLGLCVNNSNGNVGSGGFTARPDCKCSECPTEHEFWTSKCDIDGTNRLDFALHLWSDGARRFYTRFSPDETVYNALRSLPYRCDEFCMSKPYADSVLENVTRIHWIENIGTGEVYAGTDTGVVVLR